MSAGLATSGDFWDAYFMRLALALAREGDTAPNPHVGAVIAREDRLVAVGHHERAGAPHAEANALRAAGEAARGATLYVTLEPCNHHGRTPPCSEAILRAGITRVVIGAPDPNPFVLGGGALVLQAAGVRVEWSPLRPDAERLIAAWRASPHPARVLGEGLRVAPPPPDASSQRSCCGREGETPGGRAQRPLSLKSS